MAAGVSKAKQKATELKYCIETESRWKRNEASRLSPETKEIRRPSSVKMARQTIDYQKPVVGEIYERIQLAYLFGFLAKASSTAWPATMSVHRTQPMCE